LAYVRDGKASLIRTYTIKDIESLLPQSDQNYNWIVDDATKANGKKLGYYVLGIPL